MTLLDGDVRVYLAPGATDMRKSIDGLSLLVAGHLVMDPFSGHLFAFCNRSRTIVKVLYWDRNGFCVWQKRLERHRFRWPESEEEVLAVGRRELAWLLDGLDPMAVRGHPSLEYTDVLWIARIICCKSRWLVYDRPRHGRHRPAQRHRRSQSHHCRARSHHLRARGGHLRA